MFFILHISGIVPSTVVQLVQHPTGLELDKKPGRTAECMLSHSFVHDVHEWLPIKHFCHITDCFMICVNRLIKP